MAFQDNLAQMPSIDHLSGLNILDEQGNIVHHIPAVAGKLGSLKLYNTLAQTFHHQLNAESAAHGLTLFAEHVADAQAHAGKHPNIDLLIKVQQENLNWVLQPLKA